MGNIRKRLTAADIRSLSRGTGFYQFTSENGMRLDVTPMYYDWNLKGLVKMEKDEEDEEDDDIIYDGK
jgi:hypothetical protein